MFCNTELQLSEQHLKFQHSSKDPHIITFLEKCNSLWNNWIQMYQSLGVPSLSFFSYCGAILVEHEATFPFLSEQL